LGWGLQAGASAAHIAWVARRFGLAYPTVMTTEPYASARRVFWVVDNGSSHAGQASIDRMKQTWPTAELVHLPIPESWLNQVEMRAAPRDERRTSTHRRTRHRRTTSGVLLSESTASVGPASARWAGSTATPRHRRR
jgi:hypothetical protein